MIRYALSDPYLGFLCRVGGSGTATHGCRASGYRHGDAQTYGAIPGVLSALPTSSPYA